MSGLALKELESQFSIITTTKSPTTEKPTAPLKFSKLWSQAKPLAPKLERDGYRKSQLTLSRNPHIETSSGNWARVGGSWTAIEGLLEAQRRQIWELNTPEEPTLWILPLGALPDFHSGVLRKKKKNLIVLPLEGEEEEPSWNPPLPSVFVTESARRRTASPGPNLLGFYQNLTHLGRGGEFAVPADSSFTLQWSIPN